MPERRRTADESLAYVQGWVAGVNRALLLSAEHGVVEARDKVDAERTLLVSTLMESRDA